MSTEAIGGDFFRIFEKWTKEKTYAKIGENTEEGAISLKQRGSR